MTILVANAAVFVAALILADFTFFGEARRQRRDAASAAAALERRRAEDARRREEFGRIVSEIEAAIGARRV